MRPLIRSPGPVWGMSFTVSETSTTASPRSTPRRYSSKSSSFTVTSLSFGSGLASRLILLAAPEIDNGRVSGDPSRESNLGRRSNEGTGGGAEGLWWRIRAARVPGARSGARRDPDQADAGGGVRLRSAHLARRDEGDVRRAARGSHVRPRDVRQGRAARASCREREEVEVVERATDI